MERNELEEVIRKYKNDSEFGIETTIGYQYIVLDEVEVAFGLDEVLFCKRNSIVIRISYKEIIRVGI